jgi:hypothetical protein
MSDISTLKQSFKGDIVTPDHADYKAAITRWAINREQLPRIVAFVKDTDDVALALKYARSNNLQVAVRCGGHSGGSSSAHDGLVVDLSRYLNYAIVDPDKRTARVGGGSLWETVERESIKHGLATVGGTSNQVRLLPLQCLSYYMQPDQHLDRGCRVRSQRAMIPTMSHIIQSHSRRRLRLSHRSTWYSSR